MRVFVESFGCSANQADGAVLKGCLAEAGYDIAESVSAADIIVYNTCAVKGPTEDRMIELSRRVSKNKKVIIAGCLPLINLERLKHEMKHDAIIGPAAGASIVEAVKTVSRGQKLIAIEENKDNKPSLALPRIQRSSVVSIIPISYGCLGSCTYCCVVFARGRLRSYSVDEIVCRVRDDLDKGFREFWLTSQDTACYGRDIGTDLPKLLDSICRIRRDFRVRVGMMTPNFALDILEETVKAFGNDRVFKFAHLPVQSGDNEILRRMRRSYIVDGFREITNRFQTEFPQLTLATDVICGFPGENTEAFQRTLRLIEEVKPDVVNVSRFFARPKTPAAGMQREFVSLAETKRRSRMVTSVVKRISLVRNEGWVGWKGEILVDEVGRMSGSWIGRNFAYKPVAVVSSECLLGKTLTVKIVQAFPTYLEGEIVE